MNKIIKHTKKLKTLKNAMSNRRKFIKDFSISSAVIAISINNKSKVLSYDFFENKKDPFLTTGIKIGEVSSTDAIIWATLTKNTNRVSDDAPKPTILYKNDQTGIFERKSGTQTRPDREPKVIYPDGFDINTIAGAVPPATGEARVSRKAENTDKWQKSS